ncbi:MAG: hypothetical protein ACFHU9_03725 [Fluviicola sp.]
MMKTGKYLHLLWILLLIASCQDQSNYESPLVHHRKTLNIEGANADIKKSVGIDVLEFKREVDKKFDTDSFYVKVCEDLLFHTGQSKIFNEFGPFTTFDSGDSIAYSQKDSLFVSIFQSIGNNFYLDNCEGNSQDTVFCNFKKLAQENYLNVDGMFTLTVTNTIGDVYHQFKKGYLNYHELSYMVLVHHLLHDIYALEE